MHPTTTGKQTSWASWLQKNTDLFERNQGKKSTESVCTQKAKLALRNLVKTKLQWWSREEETNRRKKFVSTIIQGLKKHSSYKKTQPERRKEEKKGGGGGGIKAP